MYYVNKVKCRAKGGSMIERYWIRRALTETE